MKNFEFARFASLFKWHVVTHKTEIIRMTGYSVVGMFLLIRMTHMGCYFTQSELPAPIHLGFVIMAMAFAMCIAASSVFKDLKTKGGFINISMLPASVSEKYLTLLIYATILPFVFIILSYFIAELLNVLLFVLEGHTVQRLFIGDLLEMIFVKPFAEYAVVSIPYAIFGISLYILGGSIFRKMPFLTTSGVIMAFSIFVMPVLGNILFNFVSDVEDWELFIENVEQGMGFMIWITSVVLMLLSALNFYFSFRIYKRMQVINNKMINL